MSNNNTDFFLQLEWDKSTEDLLVTWADHAACFTWVFDKSYRRFENLNNRISVPVIVVGTIVGVLTVGINSLFPSNAVDTAQKILGAINIMLAIAGTIQNKYRWAQLSELHLSAFNEWQKFERNIKIELSIDKTDRRTAPEFIRLMRHDYDKLMNSNPIIPEEILSDFRNAFKTTNIIKPEILDTISHTTVYDKNRSITPVSSNIIPSYMKRLASLIPFTKSYKNKDNIFRKSKEENSPKDSSKNERSPTPSDRDLSLEMIKKNLERNSITVNTQNIMREYEDDIQVNIHTNDDEYKNLVQV